MTRPKPTTVNIVSFVIVFLISLVIHHISDGKTSVLKSLSVTAGFVGGIWGFLGAVLIKFKKINPIWSLAGSLEQDILTGAFFLLLGLSMVTPKLTSEIFSGGAIVALCIRLIRERTARARQRGS